MSTFDKHFDKNKKSNIGDNDIFWLLSNSFSFGGDEKYLIMSYLNGGKIDKYNTKKIKQIMLQDISLMTKKVFEYKIKCYETVLSFEKKKYDQINISKIKWKLQNIKNKIKLIHIKIKELETEENLDDIILKI